MHYRILGTSGLRVSQLFLGAMTFRSPEEARRMLDLYREAGGNTIDTASAYGDSEQVLGELLRKHRDRFVLATKFTLPRDPADPNTGGSHRKNLTRTLERSLRRLRTDHVDLLWVHSWDEYTPIGETMRALDDAVRAGKILHAGASNTPAWVVAQANTLARHHGWTPFSALQVPYNPLRRDIERELLPMARSHGLSVATYNGLAAGVLSGRFTGPGAATSGRVDPASLTDHEHRAARTLQEAARELDATAAQVAIAWALARSPRIHPVIGASSARQLRDNLDATALALPLRTMERLNALADFAPGYPADQHPQTQAWFDGGHRVHPPVLERPFGN
ncbi:oxidoreductase [Nocardiopsis terrae]|uniref:Aryl-alcohol dehydrogenase-like predicted oxidoreductase n=1 Tax=Nocardiopsis terrae TaxID=372655 RepID=A0ABR9HH11_9ACTN|nr:aldo/keto reductase [Nocardiopsis terrae]MBE1458316.1 aryl-alcohol dehydrogenase-like predicted oxidoreductase [Nocardiopsis terrae]GHC81173.1 oxidoreductase [Nocardiopsis terrae]